MMSSDQIWYTAGVQPGFLADLQMALLAVVRVSDSGTSTDPADSLPIKPNLRHVLLCLSIAELIYTNRPVPS